MVPRSISTFYQTTATLEPEKRVDILSKIAGEVRQTLVEEGDFVKEGAILCRLDDAELRVARPGVPPMAQPSTGAGEV